MHVGILGSLLDFVPRGPLLPQAYVLGHGGVKQDGLLPHETKLAAQAVQVEGVDVVAS